MIEYEKLCMKYSDLIDKNWGMLHDRNPAYLLIEELLEVIRKEKGITEDEDEVLWDNIIKYRKNPE